MKRAFVAFVSLAFSLSQACYNDRDTLGFELHNRPDVQRALTGRFDRFPPLYYEMRINRLRAKGKLTPDEYDDEAVALGRLGRTREALAVLVQKAKLPNLSPMDQYRLYANRGTIEAVKWMQDGADPKKLDGLRAARSDVAKAIAINPDAHFGRERAQLAVLDWLMSVKAASKETTPTYGTLSEVIREKMPRADAQTALAGLIMLGGAWESPDIAIAIGSLDISKPGIRSLAYARYHELLALGRKPLDDLSADEDARESEPLSADPTDTYSAKYQFTRLRAEADAWHDAKTKFMLARLQQGRHPDTDPNFWAGWTEPPIPVVPVRDPPNYALINGAILAALVAVISAGVLGLYALWRMVRGRLATTH
jgi:hypothetical protein